MPIRARARGVEERGARSRDLRISAPLHSFSLASIGHRSGDPWAGGRPPLPLAPNGSYPCLPSIHPKGGPRRGDLWDGEGNEQSNGNGQHGWPLFRENSCFRPRCAPAGDVAARGCPGVGIWGWNRSQAVVLTPLDPGQGKMMLGRAAQDLAPSGSRWRCTRVEAQRGEYAPFRG